MTIIIASSLSTLYFETPPLSIHFPFFNPYLASLNWTSSAVQVVGCFIEIVGARFLGWFTGRATVLRTEPASSCRGHKMFDKNNGQYFESFSDSTGSACHFFILLLYFCAYFSDPSQFEAWSLKTCMLWSMAATITRAKNTRHLLRYRRKRQNNFITKAYYSQTVCSSLWKVRRQMELCPKRTPGPGFDSNLENGNWTCLTHVSLTSGFFHTL